MINLDVPENIWQYLRTNWLSICTFETYLEIIEVACDVCRSSLQH